VVSSGELEHVLAAFGVDAQNVQVSMLGKGNINDTYLVSGESVSFVLQRMNGEVFDNPQRVIENFSLVTSHLINRSLQGDIFFKVAAPVPTRAGAHYFVDSHGWYWRGQNYILHRPLEKLTGRHQAYSVGLVLAQFHLMLSDLVMNGLQDPLPGFHNLPQYLNDFDAAISRHNLQGNSDVLLCLQCIDHFRGMATLLEDAKRDGILKVQPIHGDPKTDNFIFSEEDIACGLFDLDTVGGGLVHYDIGDCLRSCCNSVGEQGEGAAKPRFDLDICATILAGYLSRSTAFLGKTECGYIYCSILLITFELGVRFFTDHIRGNLYFKVAENGDNLRRAVIQFRLAEDIAMKEIEIKRLVEECYRGEVAVSRKTLASR